MADQLSGKALDARFFEVCWGWRKESSALMTGQWREPHKPIGEDLWFYLPEVSTDANACEAWAMRWAREQGLHIWIHFDSRGAWAELESPDEYGAVYADETGSDWKEAFVRACVAAGQERLKQSKGE